MELKCQKQMCLLITRLGGGGGFFRKIRIGACREGTHDTPILFKDEANEIDTLFKSHALTTTSCSGGKNKS